MIQSLKWLADADETPWQRLAQAARAGLPVPNGFVAFPTTPEEDIRAAYDEIKMREMTHFLAVRGPSHAVLNVIGPDPLIHTLRRLWAESPGAAVLVQRMIHSTWCGKAQPDGNAPGIKANEGMLMLDPDTYSPDGKHTLHPRQRKMIRYVDGTMRTVERQGEGTPMTEEQLQAVTNLAERAQGNITWAMDDQDRVWLISGDSGV